MITPGTQSETSTFGVKNHLLVILFFTLLTCLATYPLVTQPQRMVIGTKGDSLVWAWNFSWTRQALLVEHRLPFFGDHTFRPYPLALMHHSHTFFYGFIYCLGSFLYDNPYFWMNIIILCSFVLAGYGTFLLVRELGGPCAGALLAGTIFSFCSLRLERVNAHLNVLSSELIPFYLYFLFRGARTNQARFFIAAGLCFAATTWTEYYNSLFMILFTLLFLILGLPLRLNQGHTLRRRARALAPGLLLALLLLLPLRLGALAYFDHLGRRSKGGRGQILRHRFKLPAARRRPPPACPPGSAICIKTACRAMPARPPFFSVILPFF